MIDSAGNETPRTALRAYVSRKGETFVDWDSKNITDETVEYLLGGQVMFTRPRCPVINVKSNKGRRCTMPVGGSYRTCRNHKSEKFLG
jgi:hypothetical protein